MLVATAKDERREEQAMKRATLNTSHPLPALCTWYLIPTNNPALSLVPPLTRPGHPSVPYRPLSAFFFLQSQHYRRSRLGYFPSPPGTTVGHHAYCRGLAAFSFRGLA